MRPAITDEASIGLAGAAAVLRDDEIRSAVAQFAERRLAEAEVAPVLARIIDIVVDGGQHQVALTAGIRALMSFLDDNRDSLRRRLSEESPEWVPNWVDERLFGRLFTGMQSFLADIAGQDDHDFRRQFDATAAGLRRSPSDRSDNGGPGRSGSRPRCSSTPRCAVGSGRCGSR